MTWDFTEWQKSYTKPMEASTKNSYKRKNQGHRLCDALKYCYLNIVMQFHLFYEVSQL